MLVSVARNTLSASELSVAKIRADECVFFLLPPPCLRGTRCPILFCNHDEGVVPSNIFNNLSNIRHCISQKLYTVYSFVVEFKISLSDIGRESAKSLNGNFWLFIMIVKFSISRKSTFVP